MGLVVRGLYSYTAFMFRFDAVTSQCFFCRMCISRLITVVESEIVNELERLDEAQELNIEEVLQMVEPAQVCFETGLPPIL